MLINGILRECCVECDFTVKSFINFRVFLFQHEFLSVQMFKHLIVENEIEAEFKKYIDGDLEKFKTFIFELIEGASKNEAEVHEHEIHFVKIDV